MQTIRKLNRAFICFIIMILSISFLFIPIGNNQTYAVEDYRTWRQNDQRWGGKMLGNSTYSVASSGCAITSLAMLCVHCGAADANEINPGIVVDYFNSVNGFNNYGSIVSWSTISKLVPDLKFVRNYNLTATTENGKADEIQQQLEQGYYVICHVKNHFVLVDYVSDGRVYMIDPANNKTDMFEVYPETEYIDTLRLFKASTSPMNVSHPLPPSTTSKITSTTPAGTTAKTATTKAVTTTKTVTTAPVNYKTGVYKTTDPLNYRSGPAVSYDKFGVMPAGTTINVTEIKNGWGKVAYNGKTAWICLEYASFVSSSSTTTTKKVTTVSTTKKITTTPKTTTTTTTTKKITTTTKPVTTPSVTQPKLKTGFYKTTANLNYRKGNSTSFDTYGTIPNGTQIPITEISNGWGKTFYNNKEAWVSLEYASFVSDFSFSTGCYKASAALNVYESQSISSKVIMTVPVNAYFEVKSFSTIWSNITYNGKSGYVNMLGSIAKAQTSAFDTGFYKALFPVNVRNSANITDNVTFVIPANAEFTVEEKGQNAVKISYNGKSGYAFIYSAQKLDKPLLTAGEYFITARFGAAVYSSADSASATPEYIPNGYVAEITEIKNGFGKVNSDESEMWLSMNDLTLAENSKLEKGDINGDGIINNFDLAVLNQYLESISDKKGISMLRQCEIISADINCDGLVDNNDVLDYIIKISIS